MTTGHEGFEPGARPGVRANAIAAARFSRLRIVDARVSDALLDVLEDAGVGAYVEPSAGEVGIYRDVRAYSSPSDQLYVDAARRDTADEVVRAELPGMLAELERGADVTVDDDAFAAIVAGFHAEVDAAEAGWPASEDTGAPRPDSSDDDGWYVTKTAPASEDDEHFVPPPPPPLPRLSGGKLWGLVLLVGGLVAMVALPHVGFDPQDAMVIGIGTTAAGAATLVWWMRDTPADSDDDDGAVV